MNPEISVIVATKNSARYLAETLASITEQPLTAIELIVVDAGSEDGSDAIARDFGARVIAQSTGKLAAAWNLGIAAASAPLIGFLDSDDRWIAGTLRARVDSLSVGGLALSVGRTRLFLEPGHDVPGGLNPATIGPEFQSPIPGTMLIPRKVFDLVGNFDDRFLIASDVDWVGRALAHGIEFRPFDALVLEKRIHDSNLSLSSKVNSSELLRALRTRITMARQS
jgi:glycosyltransferase involved in cell wall biosynthesis